MKTKIFALLFFFLLGSLALMAGNDELSFKQMVVSQIKYPDFAKVQKMEADVYVSFTVTKNGDVIVNQSNSINAELMDYVKKELEKIKVNSDNEVIGKIYYYKIIFKYEE